MNATLVEHPQTLMDEALYALMCEIELSLNCRPMTAVSTDSNDDHPLTGNQLLTMRSTWMLPPRMFKRGVERTRKSEQPG